MKVGPTMAQLSAARRIRQQDLAACLGVHRAQISAWETGKRNPRWATTVAIAHALNHTIFLINGDGEVIATDRNIPAAIANLGAQTNTRTNDIAAAATVRPQAVTIFRARARANPGALRTETVERYAAAHGCTLAVRSHEVTQ